MITFSLLRTTWSAAAEGNRYEAVEPFKIGGVQRGHTMHQASKRIILADARFELACAEKRLHRGVQLRRQHLQRLEARRGRTAFNASHELDRLLDAERKLRLGEVSPFAMVFDQVTDLGPEASHIRRCPKRTESVASCRVATDMTDGEHLILQVLAKDIPIVAIGGLR